MRPAARALLREETARAGRRRTRRGRRCGRTRASRASACSARSDRACHVTAAVVADLTSLVVVAADSGPLLRTCIDSVLASTAAVEVIVVDNASADGEVERVVAHARDDARLHVAAQRRQSRLRAGLQPRRCARARRCRWCSSIPIALSHRHDRGGSARCAARRSRASACSASIVLRAGWHAGARQPSPRSDAAPRVGEHERAVALASRAGRRWPASKCRRGGTNGALESVDAVSGACMACRAPCSTRSAVSTKPTSCTRGSRPVPPRARRGLRASRSRTAIRVVHAQGSSSRHGRCSSPRHKHRGMWRYFRKFDPAARNPLLRAAGVARHLDALRADRAAAASAHSSAAPLGELPRLLSRSKPAHRASCGAPEGAMFSSPSLQGEG